MKTLSRYWSLYKLMKGIDKVYKEDMTEEDLSNLAVLYVDPKYKSLEKLLKNIIMDLQNRVILKGEVLEEFLGVKWAVRALSLIMMEVKNKHNNSLKNNAKTTPTPEDLEEYPDGVPLQREST